MGEEGEKCKCMCHKFTGVGIILFGLTFLLGALDVISGDLVNIIWPVLVILAGVKCLIHCGCCKRAS